MQDLLDRALGKYVIIEEIGRGGMGAVYKARDVELDRIVAIKVLSPYLVGEPRLVQRFMREARLAANLDHPNIVTIYDIGGEGSYYFFAMKYLDGQTLKQYVAQRGPLPVNEVVAIVRQLASALDYAHQQNLIHRDIKPGNVIISSDGHAWLTDFGLAKVAENLKLIASGETIGTLEYMAPEQARGDAEKQSDLYSLGVIVYEMLAGRLPFQGNNQATLLYQHLHDPPPPLHQWNPMIPPEVEQVIMKIMAKDPAERYQSAGEFFQALEEAARHALPVAPARRASEADQAGPAVAATAAAGLSAVPRKLRIALPRFSWPKIPWRISLLVLPPFLQRRRWIIPVALVALAALITGSIFLARALRRGETPRPSPVVVPTASRAAHNLYLASVGRSPPSPEVPRPLSAAQLALICGVDENGDGGRLSLWKWGQSPVNWPNLPSHPVVSLVSWSPKGDRLVMILAEAGVPNLFRLTITGTAGLNLTDSAREKSDPAWSADGLQIAYAEGSPPPAGVRDIYLVPAGGGATFNATSTKGADEWSPSWAPQGTVLVFAAKGAGITNTEILQLDLETGQRGRLTSDPAEDVFPSWSPSGKEIAFLSNRSGDFLLYAMDADGQNVRLLYDQPVWLERPSWSSNGTWLVFTQRVSGELPQVIFLDTVSGTSYPGPAGCRRPAWRPQP